MLVYVDVLVPVWHADSSLVSINTVAVHRARLVLGWVTIQATLADLATSWYNNSPPRSTEPGNPSREAKCVPAEAEE